jgi:hypothetical protein
MNLGNAALICITLLASAGWLNAQQQQPSTSPAKPEASAGGVSASQLSKANNPLADMNALNFQGSYVPALYGLPDASANTMFLRGVAVSGRQIVRATLPVSTTPVGSGQYRSGLGDFSIFDSIKLTPEGAKTDLAIGPLLSIPTATNSALGAGKWQAGVAGVAIHPLPGGSLLGMLLTWQRSFAGDQDRQDTNLSSMQPIVTASIGGGYYVKSTAVMVFDFKTDRYLIPAGLGFGKVFRMGTAIVNASIEPQFTVYHKGSGQPTIQFFASLGFQWAKKGR